MAETKTLASIDDDEFVIPAPDVSHLVTEDDEPVDNIFSERQMALLRETLYTSWAGPGEDRTFVAMGNVAIYTTNFTPPLVPDFLVSLDVTIPDDPMLKEHRCYFFWLYGKPPEVVIEVVSNRKGNELGDKLLDYARMGVSYYIVYDPFREISNEPLRIFARQATRFVETADRWLAEVDLGLTTWAGVYENFGDVWLRWVDRNGVLLATGAEAKLLEQARTEQERQRAEQERQKAEQERQRAEQERQRAEQERQKAEQERQKAEQERQKAAMLAAKLRELGIDPDAITADASE